MKFKLSSRLISIILEISIVLTVFMSSVNAAQSQTEILSPSTEGSTAEKEPVGTLDESQSQDEFSDFDELLGETNITFSDISMGDWYYYDITNLASKGIIHGYPDGSFGPNEDITYAEFTKILINSAEIDIPTLSPDGAIVTEFKHHWASPYIDAAYIKNIITDEDLTAGFYPDAPIPRSQMTKMMVLALEIPLAANVDNPFSDLADAPDIYATTAYSVYLLRGYPSDTGYRLYSGSSNATRAEASSIAIRIIDYKADFYEYKKNAILENATQNPLFYESEFIDLFHIINREFITRFTFETYLPYETWSEYYKLSNILNLEYFYTSYMRCSYMPNKNIYTVELLYGDDRKKLKNYAATTNAAAKEILDSIITDDMNTADKIIAIHDYIVLNCSYDYESYISDNIPLESCLAYGVLINGSAICQGYSAAFNLLCRKAGIPSIVVTGTAPNNPDSHAWNAVLVNDVIYYVDTTHDDPIPDKAGRVNHKYLLLTEDNLKGLGYKWNTDYTKAKYFY